MDLRRGIAWILILLAACDTEDPSTVVVENGSPDVVYRVWWESTYFPAPLATATSSARYRAVPATDYAYALLAPGWDPESTTPPARLMLLKSRTPLSVERGDTLVIRVDDATFDGNCAVQRPLAQADADFIAQSIFPGELAGVTYDAATCTVK